MTVNIKNKLSKIIRTRYLYYKNRVNYLAVAHPLKTKWINIAYISKKSYDLKLKKRTIPGEILDGDWDLNVKDLKWVLENSEKHRGLVEHFNEGIPWEDTTLFKERYTRKLLEKGKIGECLTIKELTKKYEYKIDRLYHNIKENGIIPPSRINPFIDPIYLHIGRLGDLIFTTGGNHRLSIAIILGIKRIPVRIWLRHRKWQDIRDELYTGVSNGDERKISLLKNHPDLQDILKNNRWLRNGKD
jgi:hypothetical protein